MTTENEQITPADAAIVSSGTGTKGPEERDLPASLKEEMDLCLQILREVLGEFDENLLAKFDEVREHALNASAERFSGILTDTNPDQDDLQKVVDIVDKVDVHDAQPLEVLEELFSFAAQEDEGISGHFLNHGSLPPILLRHGAP